MECTACDGGESFLNQCALAINQSSFLGSVLARPIGNRFDIGFIGLAEICGVGVRDCTVFSHPGHRDGSIESAGKGDTDFFAHGERGKYFRHVATLVNTGGVSVRDLSRFARWK